MSLLSFKEITFTHQETFFKKIKKFKNFTITVSGYNIYETLNRDILILLLLSMLILDIEYSKMLFSRNTLVTCIVFLLSHVFLLLLLTDFTNSFPLNIIMLVSEDYYIPDANFIPISCLIQIKSLHSTSLSQCN